MTVYTEDDGTEIDEDTFSAFDPGKHIYFRSGNENFAVITDICNNRYICYYCKDTVYKEK